MALTPIVEALEQLSVPYHVGGSVASSSWGLPRSSVDVDLVAELRADQIDQLVGLLAGTFFVQREPVAEAVQRRRSFNVIHLDTMVKVDVFIAEARPFDRQEMSRAREHALESVPDARTFRVKSPEDVVLRKLSWYRAGGEVSDRQWSDVVGVLKVQADRLDRDYLARWATELEVGDLLERALSEAEDA